MNRESRDRPLFNENVRPKKHCLFEQTRPRAPKQLCNIHCTRAHIAICVTDRYPSFTCRVLLAQGRVCDGYARGEFECVVSGSFELDEGVGHGRYRERHSQLRLLRGAHDERREEGEKAQLARWMTLSNLKCHTCNLDPSGVWICCKHN